MNVVNSILGRRIDEVVTSGSNISRFKQKYGEMEDEEIKNIFDRFNQVQPSLSGEEKDLFGYKTFDELKEKIFAKTGKESKKEELAADTDEVWSSSDGSITVVAPRSHKSIMHYGGGTKWCIATSNPKWWEDTYFPENTIFVIKNRRIPEDDPWQRLAVVVGADHPREDYWEFWDVADQRHRASEIQPHYENPSAGVRAGSSPDAQPMDVEEWGEMTEAMRDYAEGDQDRIVNDRDEKEQREMEERFDADDYFRILARWYESDREEIQDALRQHGFTDERLEGIFRNVHYASASNYGYEEAGYIRDEKQFWEFMGETEDEETLQQFKDALDSLYLTEDGLDILQTELRTLYREAMRRMGGEEVVSERIRDALDAATKKKKVSHRREVDIDTGKANELPLEFSPPARAGSSGILKIAEPKPKSYRELMDIMREAGDNMEDEITAIRREYESLSVEEMANWLLEAVETP